MVILIIIGLIAIIVGLVVLILSIRGRKSYISKKERCTAIVDGTLIRYEKKEFSRNDDSTHYYEIYYYPVYEYYVYNQQYEAQSSQGSKIADETLIGRVRQICYNPDNCAESYVSGEDINIAYKIVKILGIIFLVIGIIEVILFFVFDGLF